jgi:ABC-type transporter Mla subunit MlaD
MLHAVFAHYSLAMTDPASDAPNQASNGIDDLLNLVSALNPLANGVKAVDQAKRTVEALIASMELFVQSMDNLNQVASRVNRLLDDIEGPVRQIAPHINGALTATSKLADISGALNELTKRLGPLLSFLPQSQPSKPQSSES